MNSWRSSCLCLCLLGSGITGMWHHVWHLLDLFFEIIFYFYLCVCVFDCIAVCVPSACLGPKEAEEHVGSPGTGVKDAREPPYWGWELNLGSVRVPSTLTCLSSHRCRVFLMLPEPACISMFIKKYWAVAIS